MVEYFFFLCNSINEFKLSKEKHRRNYGIDLLRIFSMINIINLHINLRTGILESNSIIKYKNIWRLETFSYCAVDCFGLISGVVSYNRYKFSNLIHLWFITIFYSINKHLILLMQKRIKIKQFLLSFFPIFIKFHWYINAYFLMYLFLPFLNLGIKLLNLKMFRNLVYSYIFFFSIYYIFSALLIKRTDNNFLIGGYSSSWLTILYIIGSYLGKYILKTKINSIKLLKCFYLINYIGISIFTSEIFFLTGNRFFISYLSPTILFQAFSLIMLFYYINITNLNIIIIIKFLTPLVFSVTLIHSVIFSLKPKIIISLFNSIIKSDNKFISLIIYFISLIAFICCIIIDYFRFLLFRFLKIRELCLKIENKIS